MRLTMTWIPNALSCGRIVLSITLLFIEPLSVVFFTVYLVCGASDILDGFLARRLQATSRAGSVLDSVGDAVFVLVMLVVMLPLLALPWELWLWIGLIAVIRVTSIIVGFVRYRGWTTLHTYANKATGLALFCFPLLFVAVGTVPAGVVLCAIATVSGIEELMINVTSKTLDRDVTGMW